MQMQITDFIEMTDIRIMKHLFQRTVCGQIDHNCTIGTVRLVCDGICGNGEISAVIPENLIKGGKCTADAVRAGCGEENAVGGAFQTILFPIQPIVTAEEDPAVPAGNFKAVQFGCMKPEGFRIFFERRFSDRKDGRQNEDFIMIGTSVKSNFFRRWEDRKKFLSSVHRIHTFGSIFSGEFRFRRKNPFSADVYG
jgi:hypothetical protein